MSITDEKDETTQADPPSTEETTEEPVETQPDDSTDSDKSEPTSDEAETTDEEESTPPKKATPEESRSYYEKLTREKLEQERKALKEQTTKYTQMDAIRKAVAENPHDFDRIVEQNETLAQEMLNTGDVVMVNAFDNFSKYNTKRTTTPQPPVDIDRVVEEKLRARTEEAERKAVFDDLDRKYPGFKGSDTEMSIIRKLGGVELIKSMAPNLLKELANDLYKANAPRGIKKDTIKDAEARQVAPSMTGATSSTKSRIKLTPREESIYQQSVKWEPKLTREEFKAMNG